MPPWVRRSIRRSLRAVAVARREEDVVSVLGSSEGGVVFVMYGPMLMRVQRLCFISPGEGWDADMTVTALRSGFCGNMAAKGASTPRPFWTTTRVVLGETRPLVRREAESWGGGRALVVMRM